jgi:hypothetical protein
MTGFSRWDRLILWAAGKWADLKDWWDEFLVLNGLR